MKINQLQAAIAASLRDSGVATGSGSTTGTVMCLDDDGGREGSSSKPIVLDDGGSDHDEDTGFNDDTHTADIKPPKAARKKAVVV